MDPEHIKEIVRNYSGIHAIRFAALQQVERHLVVFDKRLDVLRLFAVGEVLLDRHACVAVACARRGLPDQHQPLAIRVRQRLQQNTADNTEDRGVRTNAKAEGQDDQRGAGLVARQCAQGVFKISHDIRHVASLSNASSSGYVLLPWWTAYEHHGALFLDEYNMYDFYAVSRFRKICITSEQFPQEADNPKSFVAIKSILENGMLKAQACRSNWNSVHSMAPYRIDIDVTARSYRRSSIRWRESFLSTHMKVLSFRCSSRAPIARRDGRKIDVPKFSTVYHPPGMSHQDEVGSGGGRFFTIELDRAWLAACGADYSLAAPKMVEGRPLALRLYFTYKRRTLSPLDVETVVLELLGAALGDDVRREAILPGWLRRSLETIHDDPAFPHTVRSLAALSGVHPVHLARVFRHRFGCSLSHYLQGLRLGMALRALENPELRIADIACATGFTDQSHLSRILKQWTGVPPAAFRRLMCNRSPLPDTERTA